MRMNSTISPPGAEALGSEMFLPIRFTTDNINDDAAMLEKKKLCDGARR